MKQNPNDGGAAAALPNMKLRPGLTLFELEQDVIVFSEAAQCLVALNASAAFVFRALQEDMPHAKLVQALVSEGLATAQDAAHWVDTTLAALSSHGMLADGHAPAPSRQSTEDDGYAARRLAEIPPYAPFVAATERRYRLLDTCALMRFAMVEQAERVDAVLGHLAAEHDAEPTMILDIHGLNLQRRGPVRSYIYRDRAPFEFTTGLHRLAPAVKQALWQSAISAHDFQFYFHAGVVGLGQSCVLLPAAAGSGKSSVTAALTHRGFKYFSDEVALIERGTFLVPPVPLAICVKRPGWDLIARYFPEIQSAMTHQRMDRKIVRYVPPPAGAIQHDSALVSHIIFPRYDENGTTKLEPVTRSEAMRRLMDECLARRQLDRASVRELIRWIEGIKCFALNFSSLDQAAELVANCVK